jgi:two-component system phosphate regulon sensor histidine kinase PhoR
VRSLTGRPFLLLVLALVFAAVAAAAILASASLLGREQALLFAIGAVAIALGAAWLPFRTLNRRFGSVADAARSMAEGDLARRVPIDGHDPLGHLSRDLNEIAERFESKLHELQEGRDSSRSILSNIPFGLALVGKDLLIRHANSRFWEMLALDRPAGDERLAAARQPILEEMALHVFHHRKAIVRDVMLYLDERREYEVRVSPIGAYAGAADAILLSLEDLGPEKAAAALRREFVANASHELKTPLTSIRGYAETLLSGGLEDEKHRTRFVETIRDQASRLEALVEDLLELADLERADAPLDLKDWDLGEIARDVATTYEDVASRRGLRLSLEGRAGLHARVDRKRLELALRNLIDNAVKYTEQGTVSVRVEEHGDAIRVCIADTGRGIASEHLPRVFERFYRVDRGRSRALGGTGLGLSIVKHAVQLHGGHVGVESEAGQGSTFWIEVPREGPVTMAGREGDGA